MTVFEQMRSRAIAEFDRLAETQEQTIRAGLAGAGRTSDEIEMHIAACLPNLAAQRIQIGEMVAAELAKVGIVIDTEIGQ